MAISLIATGVCDLSPTPGSTNWISIFFARALAPVASSFGKVEFIRTCHEGIGQPDFKRRLHSRPSQLEQRRLLPGIISNGQASAGLTRTFPSFFIAICNTFEPAVWVTAASPIPNEASTGPGTVTKTAIDFRIIC